ncbi:hypothetical protein EMCG_04484 [[Emmonsia] crescens]|uniref:Uncharacterized protein n=1 Tax=[Emmonsia] crescens TaxID=73230 RepID=A0A0G2J7D7_9EURO|nr:hypothetical protein EMCG_04484 [Emmonsia crescens UAMH 3008]
MSTTTPTPNPAEDPPAPAQTSSPSSPLPLSQQHQQQQNIPINTTSLPSSATSTTAPSPLPSTAPYQSFHTYPFATDAEFKLGLGVILGKPAGTPAVEDEVSGGDGDEYAEMGGELLLKAKIFYFAKKFPSSTPLTPQGYKTYLQHLKNNNNSTSSSSATTATTTTTTTTTTNAQQEPTYPTPFAHIIDLITNNQPIPGIQDIPDTVLTGKDKPSVAARRRKPWEVVDSTISGNDTSNEGGGDGGDGASAGGEGPQQQQQQLQ